MAEDIIRISSGNATAAVKTFGAQLTSLCVNGAEYLWQGDDRWWGGQAPVLFPIVGCVRDGHATSGAGPCTMRRHGVARDYQHEVVETTADHVTLRLDANDETLAAYPYPFRLEMTYALDGATLTQSFAVTNTSSAPMPFCVGGHPAFFVPLPGTDGERWEDYELAFEEPWSYDTPVMAPGELWDWNTRVSLIDDTDVLPLTRELFAHDTVVLEGVPQSRVTLRSRKSGAGIRVDFAGMDYLGIWSAGGAKGDAPFLAIEPWTGTATRTDEDDALEHKQGVIIAKPGERVVRSFSITVL